jgi:2-methyl-3-hydroxypyridine 5-carboxylic acid dioxygenase
MTDDVQARSAHMAETRNMAKGNNWTPRLLETANYVSAAVTPEMEARYPVPEANRSW